MTELRIDGMTCSHCKAAVQKALTKVAGVTTVNVDLTSGRAQVEGSAPIEALIAAVQDEGYQAAPTA
jgi:copper chaperone